MRDYVEGATMRFFEADPETEGSAGWDTTGESDPGLLPPEQRGPIEDEG